VTRELRAVVPGDAVLPALRDALAGGPALFVGAEAPVAEVERRVALVVETSGSSGRPKRVALSADALLANAAGSEAALGRGQWVLALPTHYIAGLNVLARSLVADLDPVAVGGAHFTAAGFLAAAERMIVPERYVALVPAQLATLLEDPRAAAVLAGFRAVLVGGQATPAALLDRARAAGVRVVRSYGSSETSGGCVYDGQPVGQAEVRIEPDGAGGAGEVWLGGPSLAEGYLGDPALTAERFVVADGRRWFRTADAGRLDGERLVVTGRRDDVIVSGGVKVALGAVERAVQAVYPDAVVVGAPDPRWGERPVAFTAAVEDAERDAEAIAAAAELGVAARPRIRHLAALPTLPSGKPDRRALAALAG